MLDYRILTDALLLHQARVPLLILLAVCLLLIVAAAVLAHFELRRLRKVDSAPHQNESPPCS